MAKMMPTMPTLSAVDPHQGFQVVAWATMKDSIKSKFVPREPREGEFLLLIRRPQTSSGAFAEYAKGEVLTTLGLPYYVIVAVKPGFCRGGEGWKKWEQLVVARLATTEETACLQALRDRTARIAALRAKLRPYDDYHLAGYQTEAERAAAAKELADLEGQ